MDVFDAFQATSYTFLLTERGTVRGDIVTESEVLTGVFKDRAGVTTSNGIQTTSSTATLHVKPADYERFNSAESLVGNGVRVGGVDYKIVGATAGTNFDSGNIEHYTLTLEVADYVG